MRASTVLFLGLFGSLALIGRARDSMHHDHCREVQRGRDVATPAVPPARSAIVRALERDHEQLAQRCRELDRSVQAVDGSLRTLRDVAARPGGEAVSGELAAVEAGRAQLQRMRQSCEAQRAALHARIQLARAGITERALEPLADPIGPIEALDQLEVERRVRPLTSRAR